MKYFIRLSLVLSILLIAAACKNDQKQTADESIEEVTDSVETKIPKARSKETIARSNSVMARIMMTKECNLVASYLVTANLADTLLNTEGPYTVFAPESEAFDALDQTFVKELPLPENREMLTSILKGHVIEGSIDSSSLAQQLQLGSVSFKTMSGKNIRIRKSGADFLVIDEDGNTAKIRKSDIKAFNGMVHVIDKVLTAN